MNPNLDVLVEEALAHGELSAGVKPSLVAARSSLKPHVIRALRQADQEQSSCKNPAWSQDEDEYLRQNLGQISEDQIARHLGRTVCAVHLRWKRDLRLPAPTKRDSEMTCEQAAQGLGVDSHCIKRLIRRGLLPARKLPFEGINLHVIERTLLLRWIVNPLNWVYIQPERVGKPLRYMRRTKKYDAAFWAYVRRLVTLKRARWRDEWWTIGKAARYHGVDTRVINRTIHLGYLPAVDYGNWWILKSHATDPHIRFYKGKGRPGCTRSDWTSAADKFLRQARKQGRTVAVIARMMKKSENQVGFRWMTLRKADYLRRPKKKTLKGRSNL